MFSDSQVRIGFPELWIALGLGSMETVMKNTETRIQAFTMEMAILSQLPSKHC